MPEYSRELNKLLPSSMAVVFFPPVVALTAGFPLKSTVPSSVYKDGVAFSVSLFEELDLENSLCSGFTNIS